MKQLGHILDDKNSFGSDRNEIELITKEFSKFFSGDKFLISFDILDALEKRFENA